MTKEGGMVIGFDRASRDVVRSLVAAIDGLAKAINNGEKVDNALLSEPVVKRLVEDVKADMTWRPRDSSRPTFEESL